MMRCGLLFGLLLVGPVAARDRDSHIPIPPTEGGMSARQLLDQKLGEAQTRGLVRDLIRNPLNINPTLREQLLKSPAAADIMRRLRDGDESLMRLVEQLAGDHPALRNLNRDTLRRLTAEAARQYTAGSPGDRRPPGTPMQLTPRIEDDADRAAQKIFNEQVQDLMREWKMDGIAEQLKETPAFRDLLQDITRNGMKPFELPGGLKPRQLDLKSLANALSKIRKYLPKNLPGLSGLRGPSVPSQLSSFSLGRPNIPTSFSTPGFGEGWSAIITVGMIGIGVGLLWWVIRWKPRRVLAGRPRVPLQVDAVNSWPELIRAFEALAINRYGLVAEHWHHRRIERQLAADTHSPEVPNLAHLYEQGRYSIDRPTIDNWEPVRASLRRLNGGGK